MTLLQRGGRLLPALEPFAGEAVAESLRRPASTSGSAPASAARREGDEVVLSADDGEVRGEEVLVATGRPPRTDDVGLETVGLEPGGCLEVDESLQVPGSPWLYGVGDVNGRALLTHMGKYQARQAGAAIVARARGEQVDRRLVAVRRHRRPPGHPRVVFTDPQVGGVGLPLAEAAEQGLPHRVVEYPIGGWPGRALFADGYTGPAIAVVDIEREMLLGVTFIGPGGRRAAALGDDRGRRRGAARPGSGTRCPSYPTISEVWLRLLETYRG